MNQIILFGQQEIKRIHLLINLNTEVDNFGRVIINDDFSINGNNSIYVIGDASNYKNFEGKPLPGIAPVAIQQGKYVS
jgi:NADH dehydrogenase